jgi:uncharacterized protein
MSKWWVLLLMLLLASPLLADPLRPLELLQDEPAPHYVAKIEVHTSDELNQLMLKAEQLFFSGNFQLAADSPVAFVLHGPEAKVLFSANYRENKMMVDLVARLTAFKVIDVRVCKTWMGGEGLDESQLLPFVSTVANGPDEIKRLLAEEQYVYF